MRNIAKKMRTYRVLIGSILFFIGLQLLSYWLINPFAGVPLWVDMLLRGIIGCLCGVAAASATAINKRWPHA